MLVNAVQRNRTELRLGLLAAAAYAALVFLLAGCTSPPPQIAIPAAVDGNPSATYQRDPDRPMPADTRIGASNLPPPTRGTPPSGNAPPTNPPLPEQQAFVDAYNKVGHPRLAVVVSPQLKEGVEDEISARAADYSAMEAMLADWLSANGRVTMVSPEAARQRLTEQQRAELQKGDENQIRQVAEQMAVDVLVQLQVRPTRQGGQPIANLISEAVNVRGGQSLGRAVVEVRPPLSREKMYEATRYLARKMMDDMTTAWMVVGAAAPTPTATPAAPPPAPAPVAPPPPPPATTFSPAATTSAPAQGPG